MKHSLTDDQVWGYTHADRIPARSEAEWIAEARAVLVDEGPAEAVAVLRLAAADLGSAA